MPAERARQDATQEYADRAAPGGDEAEDAHRLCPFGGLGEQRHHQRERDCGDDCAADPLHRARSHEELPRARQPAAERRQREECDAEEKEAPVSEQVAEPPAEQEGAAEGEEIGVHDPGE